MNTKTTFVHNVDHLVPFNSQVMIINDVPGSENGMNLIRPNTDGPPIHAHPLQEEVLTVVEGTLQVYRENTWLTVNAGESIHIPKNMAHTYRNRSETSCIFEYKITPKGSFSQMMVTLETLSKERKLTSTKDIKSIIYMAMTFKKYNKDVRSVTPPDFVMSIFSWIGKVKGYRITE
jgi:quercetin dioxygenase-like cupin family protein